MNERETQTDRQTDKSGDTWSPLMEGDRARYTDTVIHTQTLQDTERDIHMYREVQTETVIHAEIHRDRDTCRDTQRHTLEEYTESGPLYIQTRRNYLKL